MTPEYRKSQNGHGNPNRHTRQEHKQKTQERLELEYLEGEELDSDIYRLITEPDESDE